MKESSRTEYQKRINRVIDYIADHPEEELSLDNMARLSAFSPYHFHRIFRAFTGESAGIYQRRIRLDKAAYQLRYKKGKSITDIAYSLGFNSSSAFNRAFKNQFGHTPGEEREVTNAIDRPDSIRAVEILDIPSYRVFIRRFSGSFNDGSANEVWCEHIKESISLNLINEGSRFLGLVYDTPEITDEDKCRYECCITMEEDFERDMKTIEGGRHACFETACGDIDGIYKAYDWIFGNWLPESGVELADRPSYEDYYHFRPGSVRKKGEDAVYRICLPLN